jgi:hypothetical protein
MIARQIIFATSLAAATLATAGTASADEASRRARLNEIDRQQVRETEQGRYSGELTRREYRNLNADAARIQELERRAKADGYVSRREFKEIREAQTEHERHIQTESHDGQKSWWRRWMYQHRN